MAEATTGPEPEFSRGDYTNFAGMHLWPDGSAPLIVYNRLPGNHRRYVLVLHRDGARAYFDGDDKDWVLRRDFVHQGEANRLARRIAKYSWLLLERKGETQTVERFAKLFQFEEAR